MSSEEESPERHDTEKPADRKILKNRLMALAMLILAATSVVFAYQQRLEAEAQRGQVIDLYRDIKRLQEESNAARLEASKLRMVLEEERKKNQQLTEQLNNRGKK
jgi:hypothetical protein